MPNLSCKPDWSTLPNPFSRVGIQSPFELYSERDLDELDMITGHISGRSSDIIEIITSQQSAIILAGAPRIGKTSLIRYLQRPPDANWSWRNELSDILRQEYLKNIHFVQVDLTPLVGIENLQELLNSFITQCIVAIQSIWKASPPFNLSLSGLNELLRSIRSEIPNARYFVMLDTIERLDSHGLQLSTLESNGQTPQERAIALLDRCQVIRTLVDLIDSFPNFGVILSVESLPRPKVEDQFRHVSVDLARFTTITLQTFTWDDTSDFLAQEPESFGANWANFFKALGGQFIFSKEEQKWLREQAGTHPYLLHQFCFETFEFKRKYASSYGAWTDLKDRDKVQLNERINERLSTFLTTCIWKRLQDVLGKTTQDIKNNFFDFIKLSIKKQADDIIDPGIWDNLQPDLRYILYSEGIVRADLFQPIHFPGAVLRRYLLQKVEENNAISPPAAATSSLPLRGSWLIIRRPHESEERLSLTDTEFRLMKTLIEHPGRCSEEQLIASGWGGKPIGHATFTQRLFHLRKKLKQQCAGIEIIENRYGGIYTLNHPEWFTLE